MTSTTFQSFCAGTTDGEFGRFVRELPREPLSPGDVRVAVEHSSINYKDHLASSPNGKVARINPINPGIDLVGTVADAGTTGIEKGRQVIAHGYDLGVARNGGFAELTDVPAEWLVSLPTGMTSEQAMIVGTAGFTAGLSVQATVDAGISPDDGPILVTGANGGVGSVAVALLAAFGYQTVASTGRTDLRDRLIALGAVDVIDRLPSDAKPLGRETWSAIVDSVGGASLNAALASLAYGGLATACGNTGGSKLDTSVFPFILRAVTLRGIDSVNCPIDLRQCTWDAIAKMLSRKQYDLLRGETVSLDGVSEALDRVAAGTAEGRVLVRPRAV